jgi:hypothetical protein
MGLDQREEYFPKLFSICKRLEHIELQVDDEIYQRVIHDGTQVRLMPVHHIREAILPCWNIRL